MAKLKSIRFQWENGIHDTLISIEMSLDEIDHIIYSMELAGEDCLLKEELKNILEENK